jgi:hypothetical protein
MKKVVYAAAVLAMCATPLSAMAEGTTLYGQLRYSFNSIDSDKTPEVATQDGLSGRDNVSLFGLKGTYGDSVKAFFHIQTGAKADANAVAFGQRFFFAGLKGDFGKVAYGRMTNAYKFDGFKMDPFYNNSGVNASGVYNAGGATYGLSGATNGFTDNALQYVTPSMGGVKLTAGLYVDDSNADDHGYLAGVSYGNKALSGGLVFATNDTTVTIPGVAADGDAIRAYVNYKINDTIKVALSVEEIENPAAGMDDVNYVYLTGTMSPSDKMDFSASIGVVTAGAAEGTGINLGAWYNIAENTKLFALYSYADIDPDKVIYGANSDYAPSVISIGAQHKFSLSSK